MDENALYSLAFRNDGAGIREATKAGADPNAVHPRGGHTPLQVACQAGAEHAVDALISAGADPNLRFTWVSRVDGRRMPNRVALMYAASKSIVEKLVSAGAIVDAADSNGWTPLACSINAICLGAFHGLLAAGASPAVTIELNGKKARLVDLANERLERIAELAGARPNPKAIRMMEELAQIRATLLSQGIESPHAQH